MCFTAITQLLSDIYGWRVAMLFLSAINFHSVATADFLSTLNQYDLFNHRSDKASQQITANEVIRTWLTDIFKMSH